MARSVFLAILAILCFCLSVPVAQAATVTLAWDPNSETDLAGYKLYYGNSPRTQAPYPQTVVIQNKTATMWQLTLSPGVYYFALTALDTSGKESGYSNEVTAQIDTQQPPGKPGKPVLVP
jgi:hypothetical protein